VLDLYDEGDMLVAIVAVPGVAREDLKVEVTARTLTIRARGPARRVAHPRQITLPAEVNIGRVEAELADGVLTVRMPKAGPRGSRRVPVKAIAA
jgi:HSP20 family protein